MVDPVSLAVLARTPMPIAEVGGKAYNLAKLVAAGVAVPRGWVIGASSSGPIELGRFGPGPFVVRSSSPLEDRVDRVAPGVFASVVDVAPDQLAEAIEAVRASATGELAALYAKVMGAELPPSMAVIIQRYIPAGVGRAGTVYTRAPGRQTSLVIEPRDGAPIEIERDAEPPERWLALIQACLAAEAALGLDGADIEWVEGDGETWLVQARPLPPSPQLERPPAAAFEFAREAPETIWRLDLAHNPEPLSPAQQGLVDLVVERSGAGLALARGWLYYEAVTRTPIRHDDLESLFFADVEPRANTLLAALEGVPADLERALDVFVQVHALYGRVAGALASTRQTAAGRGRSGSARAQAIALARDPRAAPFTRARAGRLAGLDLEEFYRCYAVGWDVAAALIDPPSSPTPDLFDTGGDWLADLCAGIAELDDRLFYRAQSAVRRALLAAGVGDDVFWLPLADVRAGDLSNPASRAAAGRAEHERNRSLWMPVEVRGETRSDRPVGIDRRALRGRGLGGRATGRILKYPAPIQTDSIVAAVDLTPADTLAVRQASGIVLEAGSLLGHGAAMARELDIPIIVQVSGLCRIVADGEPVVLDGDAGVLLRELD